MTMGRFKNDGWGVLWINLPRSLCLSYVTHMVLVEPRRAGFTLTFCTKRTQTTRKVCFQTPKPCVRHSRVQMCVKLFSRLFFVDLTTACCEISVFFSESCIFWSIKKESSSLEIIYLAIGAASDN